MFTRHIDMERHLTTVEQYLHAADLHEIVARQYREVAKQLESGNHARAGFHMHKARGHRAEITLHAEIASSQSESKSNELEDAP